MENHYQRSSIGTSERDWSSEKIGVAPKNAPSTFTSIKRFLKIIINGGLTGVTRVHIGCKWQVTNNPFCHTKIGKNPIIDDYKCYIKNFLRPLYKSRLSTNRTNKQINFNSSIVKVSNRHSFCRICFSGSQPEFQIRFESFLNADVFSKKWFSG